MGGWGGSLYTGPIVSPVFPPGFPASSNVYYPISHSCNNTKASNSTSSSSSDDDVALVTEDPNYSEHYHQHQSRIRIMDSPPLVHLPPFYHPSPDTHGPLSIDTSYIASPTMYNTHKFMQPVSPSALKPKAHPRSNIHHKVINYKSTPHFFVLEIRIHTGTSPRESPATSPTSLPPLASLPPKPLTLAEESKKKNFFPISWRVIGGGVLLGSESKASIVDLGSPNIDDVDKHETVLEEPEPRNSSDISPPKPAKRVRSSSIPPTPTTQHMDTGALFSAESPGNL
ncbi:hypothetical protein C0993_006285 [Termitomyces sp. T159_Od127]|nr:hypothetical protein C0993_006285 [Termitomyces sp. T159_Od127]